MRYLSPVPELRISELALGCWRISRLNAGEVAKLIACASDCGLNFYDHADIYGDGMSEEVFGKALSGLPITRDQVCLQSKCGINKTLGDYFFDFSKEHILASVDGSLRRLRTDYLDVLLLHRPDALVEPQEVAEAFSQLEKSGKVRYFGVSNQSPNQIELLQAAVKQKLLFNQLQLSLMFTGMVDAGINVNMKNENSFDHDNGALDYCRLKGITVQAWSPFQYGMFEGAFVGNDKFPSVNACLDEMALKYKVSASAVAAAWLLRHPARMQAVLGTTKAERLRDISAAAGIVLSRQDWYKLYTSAGNQLP